MIHDWSRVDDYLFHNFHLGWISRLGSELNQGVLPSTHYALNETLELRPAPRFCELPEPEGPGSRVRRTYEGCLFADDNPPQVEFTLKREWIEYANRVLTIRECATHAPVAVLLSVSKQEKQSASRWEQFLRHAIAALSHGIHVMIIDLFPPSRRDPQGIHQAIWDQLRDDPLNLPAHKPLTLVSYEVGAGIVAHVQHVAVGDPLPDMPLFLETGVYVNVRMAQSYQRSWDELPHVLQARITT